MADQEIEISGDEADMIERMRSGKVDPKTVAAAKEDPPGNPPPAGEDGGNVEKPETIEQRVTAATTKAVKAATEEVTRKASFDQQTRENRGAMTDVVKADASFGAMVADDPQVFADVEGRVADALKDPESLEKIKTMSRPEYLEHIAATTEGVMVKMKQRFGITDPNENLDTRLAGGSTGVSGAGTRRGGSGTGKDEKDPEPIAFGKMARDVAFPTQLEIENRHDQRVANMMKKGEI